MGFLIFSTCVWNISHSKESLQDVINVQIYLYNVRVETWIFLTEFWKKSQMSNFMKICPVGVEFCVIECIDGQTWQG